MAGLYAPLRPSPPPTSRLLFLLTALPLSLATFAFLLQWRGGINELSLRWPGQEFPGAENGNSISTHVHSPNSSSSDCLDILGRRGSHSYPYYRGWKFDVESDGRPKVRFCRLRIGIGLDLADGVATVFMVMLIFWDFGVRIFFFFGWREF